MGTLENIPNSKEDQVPEEAKKILKSLASQWDDVIDANEFRVIPMKGSLTNEIFQIKWQTKTENTSRKVVVRIYSEGVDVFFDRDNERQAFDFMSKSGRGPRMLGQFANGLIEEFINARALSASDLLNPAISALIAVKMKEFHDLDIPVPKRVQLWDKLRIWFSVAKRLSSPEESESLSLDTIEEEISILEKELSRDHQRIGFCHNDLHYGNILLDEGTNSVIIIDYEYSSYNPVAYDIANHFCEMAASYHGDTTYLLDFSKYPGLEERKKFVQQYLTSLGGQPSDIEVEKLLHVIEKYTLASHLFWGLWGIISGHVNKIEFDYLEYSKQRFQQYWSSKYSLLGSVGPSHDAVIDNKPSPAGVPDNKPFPGGVTEVKPTPTSHHTDIPSSSNGITKNEPLPTSDKPSSDGVTSNNSDDKPSSDSVTSNKSDDKPSSDGVINNKTDHKPSTDGVTSNKSEDKPSSDGVTSNKTDHKPSSDGVTSNKSDDKPSTDGVTSNKSDDKPSSDGVTSNKTDHKPSSDGVTSNKSEDKPSSDGVTSNETDHKPSSDGVTSNKSDDKPSSDGVTSNKSDDKLSSHGVTNDKPSPASDDKASSSGVKPSSESAAANEPSTSGAAKDEGPVEGEQSSSKGSHPRNAGVFRKLKKYMTLSFFRAK